MRSENERTQAEPVAYRDDRSRSYEYESKAAFKNFHSLFDSYYHVLAFGIFIDKIGDNFEIYIRLEYNSLFYEAFAKLVGVSYLSVHSQSKVAALTVINYRLSVDNAYLVFGTIPYVPERDISFGKFLKYISCENFRNKTRIFIIFYIVSV